MRKTIVVKAQGASLSQAKGIAYNHLKREYNNNILVYGLLKADKISEPKPATQCTTINNPPDGARKWITVHSVYGVNPADPTDLKLLHREAEKTPALKKAKEISVAQQIICQVKIEKIQEGEGKGNLPLEIAALVTPKKGDGEWEFHLDVEVLA